MHLRSLGCFKKCDHIEVFLLENGNQFTSELETEEVVLEVAAVTCSAFGILIIHFLNSIPLKEQRLNLFKNQKFCNNI